MDISSLLSPQESPIRETPPPVAPPSSRPSPKRVRRTKSSTTPKIGLSPLSKTTLPPSSLAHKTTISARPPMPSPPSSGLRTALLSAASTPPVENTRSDRQLSTSGMDTLADLAAMQHHQHEARANAGGLRSADVHDVKSSPTRILPSLHSLPRPQVVSRSSLDVSMTDGLAQTPPPRTFVATSLSESDLENVARLVSYLAENAYAYESHVQLVKLLHQGFISHVQSSSGFTALGDPHTYDLLQDLRQATEAMDARFALGEDLWADRLQDQQLLAKSLEDSIGVIEACKKAVQEETGSTKLWLIYGNYMLSLYNVARECEISNVPAGGESSISKYWSEEDKLVAKEIFGRQGMLQVWQQGAEETMSRINDSHLVWDRYNELLLQDLEHSPTREGVAIIRGHFVDRLRTPHATWDQTFQSFSTFVSTYDNATYEETMVATNKQGVDAKSKYAVRETWELKLQRAVETGDRNAEWTVYTEYLDWELSHHRNKKLYSHELFNALYQRVNLRFPIDTNFWEDYLMFLIDDNRSPYVSPLPALERATRHCPWSGTLWSQYLQAAEHENLPFTDIGHIKHKATSTGLLDAGGMEEVLKIHTAWCGFLRRRAFLLESTDEELDVAEVGIRSGIEDMETLGRQKYGEEYKGDPQYRLERIYIKYLSQSRNWKGARDTWRSLVPRHGDSYEFWLRFYNWEMVTWGKYGYDESAKLGKEPTEGTRVLREAVKRTNLDWPEKIMERFLNHCEDHESVAELQSAMIQTRKATKALTKRREREAMEAAEAVRFQQEKDPHEAGELASDSAIRKRKRDDAELVEDKTNNKKSRAEITETEESTKSDLATASSSVLKRDRENATVIVKNLPPETKETRVRQYFRECGTINSLKISPSDDGESVIATIEFDSKEDVLAAQTRDMKTFDGNEIEVQVGTGSTLFITNFPPAADESYIRDMFSKYGEIIDVRFPSLKYNTHRRFCYLQFKSPIQAQAATELNGDFLGGKLKLVAKISDPGHKQDRSGALHEGRELYVSNLDWSASEDEINQIFSKYGNVEKVRIPTNMAGKSKGIAFVVFSNKDEATAALDMNLTKFKTRLLNVALSTSNPAKRQATTVISASTSPQPESASNGHTAMSPPPQPSHPSRQEISSRTLALLNVPDTVNDTRIRALVEPYGALVKIVLRPDHQGAIIEFKDVAGAGKAALGLEGVEIVKGRKIRIGSVAELLKEKEEMKGPVVEGAGKGLQTSAVVRRPTQQRKRGGKGELGIKRGNTIHNTKDAAEGDGEARTETNGVDAEGNSKAKSNADFKAMFLKG